MRLQPLKCQEQWIQNQSSIAKFFNMGRRSRQQSTAGIRHSFQYPTKGHYYYYPWLLIVSHALVLLRKGAFVQSRSWKDIVPEEDMLRGTKTSKSIRKRSRPGELTFETEENPFYFPSSKDRIKYYEEMMIGTSQGEEEETAEEETIWNPPTSPPRDTNSNGKRNKAKGNSNGRTKTKREHDNLFLRKQTLDSASNTRDIRSYRTTRTFVPPTESPELTISSLEVSNTGTTPTNENLPTEVSSGGGEASSHYVYPENSVLPVGNLPRGYFNYDASVESWYGPGYPIFKGSNDGLIVEYINNAWKDYQPPPPIPPSDAMAIANGRTSASDKRNYFYWDEFGPEGLGFGTWADTLNNLRDIPNQCGNVGKQSPIDIRPNGYACLEHHQIRTRRGDFKVFGAKNTFDLSILPSKLRVGVQRRPCKYIEHPVCSEPDPPHADFPHGWPGFVDVLHVDFKFPAEHTLNGKKFDGEMQIYHLHPGRKRLPVVSVLMEVVADENDRDAGYNDHLQEVIDGFQFEYDANRANCADTAMKNYNRRLRKSDSRKKKKNSSDELFPWDGNNGNKTSAKLADGHKNKAQYNKDDEDTMEELANATFGGEKENLREYARRMTPNSTFSIEKEQHRRRLAGIWDPYHESLVPSIYFYGYDGSLTEPPCTEIVSWFVTDETMKISRNQLEQMKHLLFTNVDGTTCQSTSNHFQSSVARPIQETGSNRQIWHCTSDNYLPD